MKLKSFFVGICTAALLTSISVSAVPENNGAVTTRDVLSTDIYGSTVTTAQTTTTAKALKPAQIKLVPNGVKDGKFSVDLNIESEQKISGAAISVTFESKTVKLLNTKQNKDAGGTAVENIFDGKYVYNYVNNKGGSYKGTYVTLNFEVKDKSAESAVLYLSVTNLDNDQLKTIASQTENGIVQLIADKSAEPDKNDAQTINLHLSNLPVTLSSLGIDDVKICEIESPDMLTYKGGSITTLAAGQTYMLITDKNDVKKYYKIVIETPDTEAVGTTAETTAVTQPSEANLTVSKEKTGFSMKNIFIIALIIIGIAVIIIEYVMIVKGDTDDEDEVTERKVRKNNRPNTNKSGNHKQRKPNANNNRNRNAGSRPSRNVKRNNGNNRPKNPNKNSGRKPNQNANFRQNPNHKKVVKNKNNRPKPPKNKTSFSEDDNDLI